MLEDLIRETDAIGCLSGDALLLLDKDGIILHATPAAAPLLGSPANQLTGLPFGIPVMCDGQAEVTLAATGRVALLRRESLHESGLPLTRVVLRDVTEHRAVLAELAAAREAAKAGERAKSHFLANITHEIRTPMIGILGMTELTLATKLTEKQREYLEMARHSAQSLLTVLNDIVDYARIEVGALELARTPFDLYATVEETISVFRPLAAKKHLVIGYQFIGAVPQVLVGDASRLRQILINLVGNAVKFTDAGSVVLTITRADDGSERKAAQLHLAVRDTGIGIPRDKIQAIFDSFTQADVSAARRYQGAGLGLAIVRHLVEMQGGLYSVESEEGQGSIFSFTLTFALPEGRTNDAEDAPGNGHKKPRPLSILLAEDNPINQLYVQELLEMDGHEVVVAHTGRRALEALRRKYFDAILMDIQMPEMDGLEATRAIRTDQTGDFDPNIPIVALTAHALKGDRETFLRAGMNEYLSKPVSPAGLEAALMRAVGDAEARKTAGAAVDEAAKERAAAAEHTVAAGGGVSEGNAPYPAPASEDGLLDWTELLAKARGNTGFLMKLFGAFVAEQPINLESMREALAMADFDQLAFMAHSLKGASATMCAPALREASHNLERAAKDYDAAHASEAFAAMERAMNDVLRTMGEKLAAGA
ncbi:multi-sensor hybrid histidine kinase [Solidesulfovibrio carbinoliphilus subsp. oakridgensis]|uniref:Sensory/regulatory protein RpfC n=1 Tax=Solidesulfovibrio carbinoliphilus subsp. oakridgensis TaxID=694327 RepID=G7Q445_9BACT|nr:ATP-binding protein [Solidesulfovibrio carbinoliphilus]EHJ46835.1 multi-sensor hybrid histidine kinase [Solidesulfovibrio carbinoliphilus subsp. oakridgensis]